MSLQAFKRSLDRVATHLPFPLDDLKEVNALFEAWFSDSSNTAALRRTLDIWVYCFVRRYLAGQFVRSEFDNVADYDQLVAITFEQVWKKAGTVKDPQRFSAWISKLCKRSFINYIRSQARKPSIKAMTGEESADVAPPMYAHDTAIIYQSLHDAIAALPDNERIVIELLYFKKYSYQQVNEATGIAIKTVRTYHSRALEKFRPNPDLRIFLDDP